MLDDVSAVLPKAQADAKALNTTLNRIGTAVGSGSGTVGSDLDDVSDALDAAIKANPDLGDDPAVKRLSSALAAAAKRADTVADDVDTGLDRVNALDRRLQSNQLADQGHDRPGQPGDAEQRRAGGRQGRRLGAERRGVGLDRRRQAGHRHRLGQHGRRHS